MVTRTRAWAGFAGLAALGLALRWTIGLRDLDSVDRWFIQDDAYYTWTIARSLAAGLGPRSDPEVLTTGFQPLLAFLEAPLFWITRSPDAPLRATLLGLATVDVALAALVGHLVRRAAGTAAGLLACAAWLLSPQAIALALGGLETTLALFLLVATAALWGRYRRRSTPLRAAGLGVCIGLTLLARVDAAFLAVGIGAYELARGERRGLAVVVASALLAVAPWWLWSLALSGSVVPESGAAARELALLYQGENVLERAWIWSAACVLANALLDLTALRHAIAESALLGPLIALAFWTSYALLSVWTLRPVRPADRLPLAALFLHGGLLALFYSCYVPAVWFFARYLALAQLGVCVLFALAVARALGSPSRARRSLAYASAGLVLVGAGAQSAQRLVGEPELATYWAIDGATGYREPMRAALAQLPPGAVVGALQSGALGYFAGDGIEVVNLDGVVSGPAAAALAEHRLLAYARERGVTHFCDWPLQHELFAARAGAPPDLSAVWQSEVAQQSGHRVRLSELARGAVPAASAPE